MDNKVSEDPEFLVMADDGTGSSVNIPTFLIGTSDGKILKEEIHKKIEPKVGKNGRKRSRHQAIILQADLRLSNKEDKGEKLHLDLWYGSIYEFALSDIQLADYAKMSDLFQEHVIFTPRVLNKRCKHCNEAHKKGLCIHDGDVCPTAPDEPLYKRDPYFLEENHLSPYKIIDENLREQCVHEAMNPKYRSEWFNFMS